MPLRVIVLLIIFIDFSFVELKNACVRGWFKATAKGPQSITSSPASPIHTQNPSSCLRPLSPSDILLVFTKGHLRP